MTPRNSRRRGFTAAELLLVVALGAVIIGAVTVSLGTILRAQPRPASFVDVPLASGVMPNFYNVSGTVKTVAVAPQYGVMALAEHLREQFLNDVAGATGVFCLSRASGVLNPYRRTYMPYSFATDGWIDGPDAFRAFLIRKDAGNAVFSAFRNPTTETPPNLPPNASIYILTYSKFSGYVKVRAIYDIDVIKVFNPDPKKLSGFYASVKRYADSPSIPPQDENPAAPQTYQAVYSGGYDIFYPPSVEGATAAGQWANDAFAPLYVTFEREARAGLREGTGYDRFKLAREVPFYLVWWPDPAASNLAPVSNSMVSSDPRQAYNHMGGRTSFMFSVPMFPSL